MSALVAQSQFAAAFTVFLVALAGLLSAALPAEPRAPGPVGRLAVALGFAALGCAALLQGSLVVARADARLVGLQVVAAGVLLVATVRWRRQALSRALLWVGLAAVVTALPLEQLGRLLPAAAAQGGGGLLVGAALYRESRTAIAARVAAAAAAALLALVLALSVALSTVLVGTVETQALARVEGRATDETEAIEALGPTLVADATLAGILLARLGDPGDAPRGTVLSSLTPGGPTDAQRRLLAGELEAASGGASGAILVYSSVHGWTVGGEQIDPPVLAALLRSAAVQDVLTNAVPAGRSATAVVGAGADSLGVAPAPGPVGADGRSGAAVIALTPLDDAYLAAVVRPGERFSLVSAGGVAARSEPGRADPAAARLATAAVAGDAAGSRAVDAARIVTARALRSDGRGPALAVVASLPTTVTEGARRDLFRTFFGVAFVASLLALALAALVGDRIGPGIRRLTESAEAMQEGDLHARSGLHSQDEVGLLGATFDSMAESIEQQSDALRQATARTDAIVAEMGEALVAVDGDGRITAFNAAAADLLHVEADDAQGQPLHDVLRVTGADGADLSPSLDDLDDGRWTAVGSLHQAGAGYVPVAMTAGAVSGAHGEVVGGVVVLRDLRAERRVEETKRHLLSRVGHELRSPLTPLIGYALLLKDGTLSPERAGSAYVSMLQAARRLERIVEILEILAALDAGRELTSETVDVHHLLTNVVARWTAQIGPSHTLTEDVADGTPPLEADERWLRRSIDELIDNALKFSPDGGVVSVTAGISGDDEGAVVISVCDQGVGMSTDEVVRAFAEWTQVDESDTRSFGGLGLGLTMVQQVVERHGGTVRCASSPGEGSTFSIVLPASPAVVRS